MRASLLLVLVLSLACGGDDGPARIAGAPTCGNGEVVVTGSVDGTTYSNQSRTGYNTFTFVNAIGDANGQLIVGFPSTENLFIEFPDFTADGALVRARGFIDFEVGGGPVAGFCDQTASFTGELVVAEDDGQFEFRLTQLRTMEPFCTADVVEGELIGCFRPRASAPDAGM